MTTAPRFVRHTGIAAAFLRAHVELEEIAPPVPEMHQHHGSHPPALPPHRHTLEPETNHHPGLHCFEGLRYLPDGRENPQFVLNQPPFRNASILIAGENFGAGSLQAFAVTRLLACGMRAIVAPSFGPVFYEDCAVYGLLPVTLAPDRIAVLVGAIAVDPAAETSIDLEHQVITHPRLAAATTFSLNPRLRKNLLLGVGDLDEVLRHRPEAERFEQDNRRRRPWVYEDDGTR